MRARTSGCHQLKYATVSTAITTTVMMAINASNMENASRDRGEGPAAKAEILSPVGRPSTRWAVVFTNCWQRTLREERRQGKPHQLRKAWAQFVSHVSPFGCDELAAQGGSSHLRNSSSLGTLGLKASASANLPLPMGRPAAIRPAFLETIALRQAGKFSRRCAGRETRW